MPPVKLAVPVIATLVKVGDGVAVAFTVNVVLIVAAGAAEYKTSANPKLETVLFIFCESPPLF